MENQQASFTSVLTAFGRAYHSRFDTPKIFDDFLVNDLIAEKEFEEISRNMVNGIDFFNPSIKEKYQNCPDKILRWINHLQLAPTSVGRSAYCEQVLHNEILLGTTQYVILGAGLDTYSFRHSDVSNLDIYEVDHPATQESKKLRIQKAGWSIPSHLHFVPMDFSEGYDCKGLLESSFSPDKKTFFSLLGVSYYLKKEEIAELLKALFADVPAGSSIVFDYADEQLFREKGRSNRVQQMVQLASATGEPMKSCFSFEELERLLEETGLLIYEHLSPVDIQEQFFENRSDELSAFETIHYVHAEKR
ncbi:class I SAM-dependent methyltransferase [Sporosarcina cyprini]|uniref:class I SAM-dependent methyltransferase n=1 Tax=Sporosarcina cyprini TaxID=2910523 RepID=UPI001EE03B2E|nr:class I SAM-dependent methyltransferase [Sporosarcina cyprini]MCG3088916.1 class I SAM-dependent methyltransferase [Sporosarcina cyprini]